MIADRRRWTAALALLVIASLALCLLTDGYSLWADEIASLQFASRPLSLLWSNWMLRETNPPLFYSLLHGWTALFGWSDAAVRALPILIAAAGVPILYLVVRHLSGPPAALFAAALLALSGQHVFYAQQLRAYGMAQTAALAALYAVVRVLDAPRKAALPWLALYVAACLAALYSHTTLLLLPAVLNLYVLPRLLLRRDPLLIGWVAANALVLLGWAWWGWITVQQILHPATIAWIAPLNLQGAARGLLNAFVPDAHPALRVAYLLAALVPAGLMTWRHRRDTAVLLPIVAVATPVLLAILSLKTPMFLPRTILWAQPAFLGAFAIGVMELRRRELRWAAVAIALLATIAGAVLTLRDAEKEPWARLAADIQRRDPDAAVIAGSRIVGWALGHYCPPAACALRIYTVDTPAVWEADFPVARLVRRADVPAILARERVVFTAHRAVSDPAQALAGHGRGEDLSRVEALPPTMSLQRWTAAR